MGLSGAFYLKFAPIFPPIFLKMKKPLKNLTAPYSEPSLFSATVIINSNKERKDGNAPLSLLLVYERKKKQIALKLYWPPIFFDKKAQAVLPRYKNDQEAVDTNIIIGTIKARANEIIRSYRLQLRVLTLELFVHEYNNFASRDCFLFFATSKNNSLYEKGINTYRTRLRHQTALNCLGSFMKGKQLLMRDFSLELVRQLDAWLRKSKRYKYNTIMSTHKIIKTYIYYALKDGYYLDNPYDNFPISFRDADREALDRDELASLKALLNSKVLNELENECLRKFLFSCYTGIRISDSALISSSQIKDGVIKMKMKKGERFGKEIKVPLPKYARDLIDGRKGLLFRPYADKTVNEALKVIAAHAGITKNLSFHVSRDTFGTLFMELGGDIASLQELMGHSKIQTTMIYVKMSEQRKEKLMMNFDKLDE